MPLSLVPRAECVVCGRVAFEDDVEGFFNIIPVFGPTTVRRLEEREPVMAALPKGSVCGRQCGRALLDMIIEPYDIAGEANVKEATVGLAEGHPGQFL
jgi:hypothetical protein